jgi:predicted transcriptional regulator
MKKYNQKLKTELVKLNEEKDELIEKMLKEIGELKKELTGQKAKVSPTAKNAIATINALSAEEQQQLVFQIRTTVEGVKAQRVILYGNK